MHLQLFFSNMRFRLSIRKIGIVNNFFRKTETEIDNYLDAVSGNASGFIFASKGSRSILAIATLKNASEIYRSIAGIVVQHR